MKTYIFKINDCQPGKRYRKKKTGAEKFRSGLFNYSKGEGQRLRLDEDERGCSVVIRPGCRSGSAVRGREMLRDAR
jgi:hypothetical protein